MPFQSESQRKYLYSNEPEVAKKFEEETTENAKLPQYLANGGFPMPPIPSSSFDVDKGASTTALGAPYVPSPMPPPITPAPLVFKPKGGLPPPVTPPVQSAAAPAAPTGPDPYQAYLGQQRERLSKLGPEEQTALEENILKRRRGLIPNLANAGAGLADAIMQGVARAGSSNFQSNLQDRLDKTDEGQRKALASKQAAGLAQMKQEMELAQMDPESPLSRSTQRAYAQQLKLMGARPEDIANIPASMMSDVLSKRMTLEEIREKAKSNELMQEQNAIALGIKRQSAEEASRTGAQERKLKGLEGYAKLPWHAGITNPEVAEAFKNQAGLGEGPSFASEDEAKAANLQDGTRVTIGGVTGTWKN